MDGTRPVRDFEDLPTRPHAAPPSSRPPPASPASSPPRSPYAPPPRRQHTHLGLGGPAPTPVPPPSPPAEPAAVPRDMDSESDLQTSLFVEGRDTLESEGEWDEDPTTVAAPLPPPPSVPPPASVPPSVPPPAPSARPPASGAPPPAPSARPPASGAPPPAPSKRRAEQQSPPPAAEPAPAPPTRRSRWWAWPLRLIMVAAFAAGGFALGRGLVPLDWIPVERIPAHWVPEGWDLAAWISPTTAVQAGPVQAPGSSASAAPSASASAPPPPLPLHERAARGDPAALAELEERPAAELGVEQAVAIARARELQRRARLTELAEQLTADPSLADKEQTIGRLLRFAADPRTAPGALRVIAGLPGTLGPDLLYQLSKPTGEPTDSSRLASQLLLTAAVRKRASEALSVALDLAETRDCKAVAAVLPRAIEHADTRAVPLLVGLLSVRGCGPNETRDCYPCLRYGRPRYQLQAAVQVARKRDGPEWQPAAAPGDDS